MTATDPCRVRPAPAESREGEGAPNLPDGERAKAIPDVAGRKRENTPNLRNSKTQTGDKSVRNAMRSDNYVDVHMSAASTAGRAEGGQHD
ncbi:MAG: hypothetical protein C5B57_05020 [Blastocatellia bacterium]|nr:MAG: hypothetical protein C5B57_05020 [Blastocatellia bacterium]